MALLPGDDGPYVFTSRIPASSVGKTLLEHLSKAFAYHAPATWEALVRSGAVGLDGAPILDPGQILALDQELSYCHGEYREPDVPTDWRVDSRGEDWMAVVKPSGQPIHSTSRIFRQTLVWQVRRLHGLEWSPCHRLDRDTSGLVLFGRSRQILSWVQTAFERRRVEKEYRALLLGRLEEPVEVDAPIGPAEDEKIRSRLAVRESGKEARTSFEPLAYDAELAGTWCRVRPHQGRRHQIRVHAEHIGHPIVGDPLYDGHGGLGYLARLADATTLEIARVCGAERLWLHSCALDFLDQPPGDLPRSLRIDAPGP